MIYLNKGMRELLEISFNLWVGIGFVRGGVGIVFVGDLYIVVERIKEYELLGIDMFVLLGYLYLEEVYEVVELLFLLLKDKKKEENKIVGEMIVDVYVLKK